MPTAITASDRQTHCDRRTFLTGLGCAGASLLLGSQAAGLSAASAPEDALLCLGSASTDDPGTLHLLEARDGRCEELDRFASPRPFSMVRHPQLPLVYVANAIRSHAAEPRGTIEAFLIDWKRGKLELLARQPLSLSATEPTSIDVSPDGAHLIVAAFGGGAYNMLPLDAAGLPGAPEAILKQVGRVSAQPSRAHPAAVLFHPHLPWAVAADFGADRLDLLSLEQRRPEGACAQVANRTLCRSGSGPSGLAIDSEGTMIVVRHRLQPTLSSYRLGPSGDLNAQAETGLDAPATALTFHAQGDLLSSTESLNAELSRLKTWRVPADSEGLRGEAELTLRSGEVFAMLARGTQLWLASERGLIEVALNPLTGLPVEWKLAAEIPGGRSLTTFRVTRS